MILGVAGSFSVAITAGGDGKWANMKMNDVPIERPINGQIIHELLTIDSNFVVKVDDG